METEALRQQVLSQAGVSLDFGIFDFKGIPGFEIETFYNESGIADTVKQNFKFQVSVADVKMSGVKVGDYFTLSDDNYDYMFIVEGMQPDITGWYILSAGFQTVVES